MWRLSKFSPGPLFLALLSILACLAWGVAPALAYTAVMVKDINPSGGSSPRFLTNMNGTLFFGASDGIHGYELWKSDGTPEGTVMFRDINPSGSSYPWNLTSVNGSFFFAADDGVNGYELWKTDGTPEGTVMVADINPSGNSIPSNLTNVNGTLFFTADNGVNGWELWKFGPEPADVEQVVNQLVAAGILTEGEGQALGATLQTAQGLLGNGNNNAACNVLQAFIQQVSAMVKSGRLSQAEGEALKQQVIKIGVCS